MQPATTAGRGTSLLRGLGVSARPVDMAKFTDSLAARTQWTSLARHPTVPPSHRLVESGVSQLRYRPGPRPLLSALGFVLIGAAMVAGGVLMWLLHEDLKSRFWAGVLVVAGAPFLLAPLNALKNLRPIVFDRAVGFWIGWRRPDPGHLDPRRACAASDIAALQLLVLDSPLARGQWVYELNLVRRSAERIHVLAHGDYEALRADAGRLATFLGCRLWDGALHVKA